LKCVDIQKSSADDSSGRPSGNVDRWSTTRTTVDSQARKTVAEDMTTSGTDEFDVYTIETALPHVEWERIEESLRMSAGEQNKRWVSWSSAVHNYILHTSTIIRRWPMCCLRPNRPCYIKFVWISRSH